MMQPATPSLQVQPPHLAMFAALAPLTTADTAALLAAGRQARTVRAKREVAAPGQRMLVVDGWAMRARSLPEGRRQIVHLLLPGDIAVFPPRTAARSASALTALTEVRLAPVPDGGADSALPRAYARAEAIARDQLHRQIVRLGRLDAYERIIDLLLELDERLIRVGLSSGGTFPLPLTQEMLGDLLGLTSVHVNRTLQLMRREGAIELRGSLVRLVDAARLAALVDYQPSMVDPA